MFTPSWADVPHAETLDLYAITRADLFQVRRKLDPPTVWKYASNFKAGTAMPPLKIARVASGELALIDGYHRARALETLGWIEAQCIVIDAASLEEARWLAGEANLAHGLPLKAAEVREVFHAFIKARRYRKAGGGFMSYREIAAVLGRPHSTIRHWMFRYYPKIAKRMGETEQPDTTDKGGDRPAGRTPVDDPYGAFRQSLDGSRLRFHALTDGVHRGMAIEAMRDVLHDAEMALTALKTALAEAEMAGHIEDTRLL